MPPKRKRHFLDLFKQILSFAPIAGLFGHRQVGKSTFLKDHLENYVTLDSEEDALKIKKSPAQFIKSIKKFPVAIDECQSEPRLFPALKNHLLTNKRPGQFILSGSVRFTSHKSTRESLAGRMTQIEILPFSAAEIESRPLPKTIPQILGLKKFDQNLIELVNQGAVFGQMQKAWAKYLERGGLPGILFIREEKLRISALQSLLHLMLDRDLRMVISTRLSLEAMIKFLSLIAQNTFQDYNFTEMARKTGLTPKTQKNLLFGMESIFLLRRINHMTGSAFSYLLEDQLEEKFLSEGQLDGQAAALSAFYRNIRSQFTYRLGESAHFSSYQTRSGAKIPLVVATGEKMLGFRVLKEGLISLSEKRAADSFLRNYPEGRIIFLSLEKTKIEILDTRIIVCHPAHLI